MDTNLLTKLNQYKEMITLIIFFLGGLSWIYGFFATKEQVDILECLLEKNVIIVENKLEFIHLEEQRNNKYEESYNLSKVNTEAGTIKAGLIKSEIRLIEEQLAKTLEKINNASNDLRQGACRKG